MMKSPMVSRKTTILLDWDGTCANTEEALHQIKKGIFIEFLTEVYPKALSLVDMIETEGRDFAAVCHDLAENIVQTYGIKIAFPIEEMRVKKLRPAVSNAASLIELTPFFRSFVEQNCDAYTLAIVSNSPRANIVPVLERHQMSGYFPQKRIFGAPDIGPSKPAPHVYLYAMDVLNVAPIECVALEDSMTGIKAARAAAIDIFGCTGLMHGEKKTSFEKAMRDMGILYTGGFDSAELTLMLGGCLDRSVSAKSWNLFLG